MENQNKDPKTFSIQTSPNKENVISIKAKVSGTEENGDPKITLIEGEDIVFANSRFCVFYDREDKRYGEPSKNDKLMFLALDGKSQPVPYEKSPLCQEKQVIIFNIHGPFVLPAQEYDKENKKYHFCHYEKFCGTACNIGIAIFDKYGLKSASSQTSDTYCVCRATDSLDSAYIVERANWRETDAKKSYTLSAKYRKVGFLFPSATQKDLEVHNSSYGGSTKEQIQTKHGNCIMAYRIGNKLYYPRFWITNAKLMERSKHEGNQLGLQRREYKPCVNAETYITEEKKPIVIAQFDQQNNLEDETDFILNADGNKIVGLFEENEESIKSYQLREVNCNTLKGKRYLKSQEDLATKLQIHKEIYREINNSIKIVSDDKKYLEKLNVEKSKAKFIQIACKNGKKRMKTGFQVFKDLFKTVENSNVIEVKQPYGNILIDNTKNDIKSMRLININTDAETSNIQTSKGTTTANNEKVKNPFYTGENFRKNHQMQGIIFYNDKIAEEANCSLFVSKYTKKKENNDKILEPKDKFSSIYSKKVSPIKENMPHNNNVACNNFICESKYSKK